MYFKKIKCKDFSVTLNAIIHILFYVYLKLQIIERKLWNTKCYACEIQTMLGNRIVVKFNTSML